MEVIEVEGLYTMRNKIHRLPINVGQRYSVIVTANQPIDNYIMRSEFEKTCMPDDAAKLPIIKAIVHYDGAPEDIVPGDAPWTDFLLECIDLDQNTLKPLYEETLPAVTKEMELTIAFHNDSAGVIKSFLNESSYVPDINYPTLSRIYGNDVNNLPTTENAYTFNNGDVLQISFISKLQ
jgi:hypothetical protein